MLDRNDGMHGDEHLDVLVYFLESDIDDALTCPDAMADIVSEVVAYIEDLNNSNGNELYNFFHSKKSCELDLAFEIKQLGRNVARRVLEKEVANRRLSQ